MKKLVIVPRRGEETTGSETFEKKEMENFL